MLLTRSLAGARYEGAVEACLRGGAAAIQLREKGLEDEEFVELALAARRVTDRHGGALIVNDRPDVALAARADGVHLGQGDAGPREVRRRLGPGFLLGVSCHSVRDAARAVEGGADYLGVGPVFATRTKAVGAPRGTSLVREVRRRTSLPCFAIGGIDLENLDRVLETGCDGVAVCSAILRAPSIEQAARRFARRIRMARERGSAPRPGEGRGGPPLR